MPGRHFQSLTFGMPMAFVSTTPVIERLLNDVAVTLLPLLDDKLPVLRRPHERLASADFIALFSDEDAAAIRLGERGRIRVHGVGHTSCRITVMLRGQRRIALRAEVVRVALVVGLVEIATSFGWDVAYSGGIESVTRINGLGMIKHRPAVALGDLEVRNPGAPAPRRRRPTAGS